MTRRMGLGVVFGAMLVAGSVWAAAPAKLGYQGRLLQADGTPESGVVAMKFSLFRAETGGTAIWSENQSIGLSDGYYATFLGDVTNLNASLFDGTELYLELEVNGSPLLPRQRVASVAYALAAETAKNVAGGTVSATSIEVGGHTIIDSNGALHASSLDVGGDPVVMSLAAGPGISIDASNPNEPTVSVVAGSADYVQNQTAATQNASFAIGGNARIGGLAEIGGTLDVNNTANFRNGITLNGGVPGILSWDSSSNLVLRAGAGKALHLGSNETNDHVVIADGNVGIGTTSPSIATPYGNVIDIRGKTVDQNWGGGIRLASNNGTTTNSIIRVSTNGLDLWNTLDAAVRIGTNDNEKMRVDSNGNVGIGTTTPASLVHIKGLPANQGPDLRYQLSVEDTTASTYGVGGGIQFLGAVNAAGASVSLGGIRGYKANGTSDDYAGRLHFLTRQNATTSNATRMVIDERGHVGIGTTNPSQTLEVVGGLLLRAGGVSRPTCNGSARGTFWFSTGGTGAKDTVDVCAKGVDDMYAWRTLY